MNVNLLSAAVHHAAFLNTLQTAILYDLCANADEDGEVKPNVEAMAVRWRVKPYAIKAMLKELVIASLIEKCGIKYTVSKDLFKCPNGQCPCPNNPFLHPADTSPKGLEGDMTVSVRFVDTKAAKPLPDPLRPNPGSLNGIWDKLKTHWKTRWGTSPISGYIERQLGEVVRGILEEKDGSLDTLNKLERAFVNFLTAAKDSEAGKISLNGFGSTWQTWTNQGDSVKTDAKAMLEDALDL